MVKTFIDNNKIILLEWYMVAATCYLFMTGMNINMAGTAIAIGLVNTYVVAPISHALLLGNNEEEFPRQKLLKNIFKSFIVCSIMFFLYYLTNRFIFATKIEPITFGVIYKLIDIGFSKITNKWD